MPSEIPSLDWWVTAGKATRAHWECPERLRGWTQHRAQMFPELLSSQMESELHRGAGEMQLLSPEGDVLRQSRDLKENLIRSDPKGFNCSPTHHSCRARSDCPAQDLLHKTNPLFLPENTPGQHLLCHNISAAAVTASVLPRGHEAPAGSDFLPGLLQLLPCPSDRAVCIKTDQLLIQAVLAGWRAPRQPISHPARNRICLCCCSVFIAVPKVIASLIFCVWGF